MISRLPGGRIRLTDDQYQAMILPLVIETAPLNDEGELGDNIRTCDVLVGEAE